MMDGKRGWVNFVLTFVFVIISIGLVSSAACSITTSCAADRTVMKLSSSSGNAHGAFYNQGTYTYYLCWM